MRDPRLDWDNFNVVQHRTQRRQEEQALLNTLSDLSSLRRRLRQWWLGFVKDVPQSPNNTDLREVASQLTREEWGKVNDSHVPLLEALFRSITEPDADDTMTRLARFLLAEEIGHAAAVEPASIEAVLRANNFVELISHNWIAFRDAFVAVCKRDKRRRDVWCKVLGELPGDLKTYLNITADEQGILNLIQKEESAFKESGNPVHIWRQQPIFVPMATDIIVRLGLLSALDSSALLTALENIPSARFISDILDYLDIGTDQKWILFALRKAELVYDEQGLTGKRVLLSLIEAILKYGIKLEQAVARAANMGYRTAEEVLESLRQTELPAWFRTAFGTLLDRPDGNRVAIEYAAALAKKAQYPTGSQQNAWSASLVALNELTLELQAKKVQLTMIEETMMKCSNRMSMSFFLVGCEVELNSRADGYQWDMRSNKIRECAWKWYERMLKTTNEDILLQVSPYNTVDWPFYTSGAVLVGFDDPVNQWQQTWENLFEGRFQARFCFELKLLEPSLHLIKTGIGAIEVILSEHVSDSTSEQSDPRHKLLGEPMRRLWRTLLKSLQYLVIGQGGPDMLSARQTIARLFAYMPAVFGSSLATEFALVAPLLNVDETLALRAAYFLLRGGASRKILYDMFTSQQMNLKHIGEVATSAVSIEPSLEPAGTLEAMFREVWVENSVSDEY